MAHEEEEQVPENETVPSEASTNPLDELNDVDLIKLVDDLKAEVVYLELENEVFENFLLKNDPVSLNGMSQILEAANKLQSQTQNSLTVPNQERKETLDSISPSTRRTESLIKFGGLTTTSMTEKGPRVNLSQRMDLVMREMEETQIALADFVKRSHRSKCNLKADLEEIGIREQEVTEAKQIFESRIVIEGIDPLTQRIPAEKFLRYMEEWLRTAELTLEKMRLRTNTLKATFTKVTNQLIQKEELGEAVDAVDFDQLRIQNRHLAKKIDQKNTHLLELKKMNGAANLVLSTHKKYLQKQVTDINLVKESIKSKEKKIIKVDDDCTKVEREVDKERGKLHEVINLIQSYRVPPVMDYVKIKTNLSGVKKEVKVFQRKNAIQQSTLNSCVREMKTLTGSTKTLPEWYQFEKEKDDEFSVASASQEICSNSSKNSSQD